MWLEIQIFGFRALWSPYFLTFVALLGVAYYLITGPYRSKFGGNSAPTLKQKIYFLTSLLLLYIAIGSPVDLLSHIMLTAHMIQMVILYFIFPIFFIKGIPEWIWEKIVYAPIIKPIFKVLTKPLVALISFNTLFALYHMPSIFDFSKSSIIAHTVILVFLLLLSFTMWWSIMPPLKEFDTLFPLLKIGTLVASAAIVSIACALIIFASTPQFNAYSSEGSWIQAMSLCVPNDVLNGLAVSISGPEMFSPLSVLDDQQLGGIVMMLMQEAVYIAVMGRIFFAWFNKESLKVDALPDSEITNSN